MAFDFDDLEEEVQQRIDAGEADAATLAARGAVEGPGAWTGGYLPPMRNIDTELRRHLPSKMDLRQYLPTMQLADPRIGGVRMRLFIFYGAGDNVAAWVNFLLSEDLPDWLDMAVFESPGHGQRKDEQIPDSLADISAEAYSAVEDVLKHHARGGKYEGAPFAFAGHSMGTQVMVEVAMRAKRSLGVEPACLFAMERGAPHLPLYTDEGHRLLCLDEPAEFFEGFNPMIHKLMSSPARKDPKKDVERMIRMWQKDLRLSQEHLNELGSHIFRCDIHVFRAVRNFHMDEMSRQGQKLPAEMLRVHEINCRLTTSGPESSACWAWQSYDDWGKWTAERCMTYNIDADHVTVKLHRDTARKIAEVLAAMPIHAS